jgi:polysaccharide export outer membrane protein
MVSLGRVLTLVAVAASHAACAGNRIPDASTPPVTENPAAVLSTVDSLRLDASVAAQDTDRSIVPGDLLEVLVFDAPDLTRTVRVSDAGAISLPLLGAIQVTGKTARQLEVAVQDRLRGSYMLDPHVTVEVKEAAAQPIYVLGEVNQPGAFTATGTNGLTILQAVAVARGLKPTASRRRAVIIRYQANGDALQIPVNLGDVVKGKAADLVLQPSDVVYVQKNSERAVALGLVDALLRAVTFRAVF